MLSQGSYRQCSPPFHRYPSFTPSPTHSPPLPLSSPPQNTPPHTYPHTQTTSRCSPWMRPMRCCLVASRTRSTTSSSCCHPSSRWVSGVCGVCVDTPFCLCCARTGAAAKRGPFRTPEAQSVAQQSVRGALGVGHILCVCICCPHCTMRSTDGCLACCCCTRLCFLSLVPLGWCVLCHPAP